MNHAVKASLKRYRKIYENKNKEARIFNHNYLTLPKEKEKKMRILDLGII